MSNENIILVYSGTSEIKDTLGSGLPSLVGSLPSSQRLRYNTTDVNFWLQKLFITGRSFIGGCTVHQSLKFSLITVLLISSIPYQLIS